MWFHQAIVTKYHGPTNTRGSRISATTAGGRTYFPYDYSKSVQECHAEAARLAAARFGWNGVWVGGCMPSGDYAWTQAAPNTTMVVE